MAASGDHVIVKESNGVGIEYKIDMSVGVYCVYHLKQMIQAHQGYTTSTQTLLFNGVVLRCHEAFSTYGIQRGSIITLVVNDRES